MPWIKLFSVTLLLAWAIACWIVLILQYRDSVPKRMGSAHFSRLARDTGVCALVATLGLFVGTATPSLEAGITATLLLMGFVVVILHAASFNTLKTFRHYHLVYPPLVFILTFVQIVAYGYLAIHYYISAFGLGI